MPASVYSVGVDLGGTWIRLEAVDVHRRRCRSFKAPAPDLASLPRFLKTIFNRWKIHPEQLTIGSRGVWKPAKRQQLSRALKGLATRIRVMSDVEAAWYAAFGQNGSGIIVIAGTGSIAYGQTQQGRRARAGGLGPQRGDEGSAFWIGKVALDRPLGSLTHARVRQIASRAPAVLRQANAGNTRAQRIVFQAQEHLANLAGEVAKKLSLRGALPLGWGGRLLEDSRFRTGWVRALRKTRNASRFKLKKPGKSVALAMAQWTK